ncbi:uncharacterized protein BcabD6B2_22590 [Babesia caballi]|uniref:Uncharacterized protein n=1 Tax=Babesia caballi TaxID=5871 RepID=A0AAV4LSM2_BABCB|nr:hypothetical protein BcabD6B2_22590 [Babesia caballi]
MIILLLGEPPVEDLRDALVEHERDQGERDGQEVLPPRQRHQVHDRVELGDDGGREGGRGGDAAGNVHRGVAVEHLEEVVPAAHGVGAQHLAPDGGDEGEGAGLGGLASRDVVEAVRSGAERRVGATPDGGARLRPEPAVLVTLERVLVLGGHLAEVDALEAGGDLAPETRAVGLDLRDLALQGAQRGPDLLVLDVEVVDVGHPAHVARLHTVLVGPAEVHELVRGAGGVRERDVAALLVEVAHEDHAGAEVKGGQDAGNDQPGLEDGVRKVAVEPPIARHDGLLGRTRLRGHDVVVGGLAREGHRRTAVGHEVEEQNLERLDGRQRPDENGEREVHDLADVGAEQEGDELLDVGVDGAARLDGVDDGAEVVVQQNHVGSALGDVSAVDAHGNTNVRGLERRGVVHAVASHGREVALALERLHNDDLVLRLGAAEDGDARRVGVDDAVGQVLPEVVVVDVHVAALEDASGLVAQVVELVEEANLLGNGGRSRLLVAGDHDDAHAGLDAGLHRAFHAEAGRVEAADAAEHDQGRRAVVAAVEEPPQPLLRVLALLEQLDVLVSEREDADQEDPESPGAEVEVGLVQRLELRLRRGGFARSPVDGALVALTAQGHAAALEEHVGGALERGDVSEALLAVGKVHVAEEVGLFELVHGAHHLAAGVERHIEGLDDRVVIVGGVGLVDGGPKATLGGRDDQRALGHVAHGLPLVVRLVLLHPRAVGVEVGGEHARLDLVGGGSADAGRADVVRDVVERALLVGALEQLGLDVVSEVLRLEHATVGVEAHGGVEGELLAHPGAVLVVEDGHGGGGHLALGEGAGLVTANYGTAPQSLNGGELPNVGVALGHVLGAHRKRDGDDHGQTLGDRGDGEADGQKDDGENAVGVGPRRVLVAGHNGDDDDGNQDADGNDANDAAKAVEAGLEGSLVVAHRGLLELLGDAPDLSLHAGADDDALGRPGNNRSGGEAEIAGERRADLRDLEETHVGGNGVTHLQNDHVAGDDVLGVDDVLLAVANDRGGGRGDGGQLLQSVGSRLLHVGRHGGVDVGDEDDEDALDVVAEHDAADGSREQHDDDEVGKLAEVHTPDRVLLGRLQNVLAVYAAVNVALGGGEALGEAVQAELVHDLLDRGSCMPRRAAGRVLLVHLIGRFLDDGIVLLAHELDHVVGGHAGLREPGGNLHLDVVGEVGERLVCDRLRYGSGDGVHGLDRVEPLGSEGAGAVAVRLGVDRDAEAIMAAVTGIGGVTSHFRAVSLTNHME